MPMTDGPSGPVHFYTGAGRAMSSSPTELEVHSLDDPERLEKLRPRGVHPEETMRLLNIVGTPDKHEAFKFLYVNAFHSS